MSLHGCDAHCWWHWKTTPDTAFWWLSRHKFNDQLASCSDALQQTKWTQILYMTQCALLAAFRKYGAVDARVMLDRITQRSRGFGFVHFDNKEDLEEAIEKMHDVDIDGRKISVTRAIPQERIQPGTPAHALSRRDRCLCLPRLSCRMRFLKRLIASALLESMAAAKCHLVSKSLSLKIHLCFIFRNDADLHHLNLPKYVMLQTLLWLPWMMSWYCIGKDFNADSLLQRHLQSGAFKIYRYREDRGYRGGGYRGHGGGYDRGYDYDRYDRRGGGGGGGYG